VGRRVSRDIAISRGGGSGAFSRNLPQTPLEKDPYWVARWMFSDARLTLVGVKSFRQWGIGKMGALSTGVVQSWLTIAMVVLSQLFTLLFIGIVSRLLQQRKARGLLGEQSPRHRASTSTQGRRARRLSRLAEVMTRSRWMGNYDPSQCGRRVAQ